MAGGIGTRLWPLSTQEYPKQFAKIFDDLSMLQKTLIRNKSFGKPIVITNKEYENLALEQAREVDIEIEIISEPLGKNTTPCAVIASLVAINQNFRYVLLLPADHYIEGSMAKTTNKCYEKAITKAINYAENSIVALGIKPNFASTSYGYIKVDKMIKDKIYEAVKFIEKPDIDLANNIYRQSNYFWNSGIFIYDANFLLEQAALIQPALYNLCMQAYLHAEREINITKLADVYYENMQSISLDHSIMEYLDKLVLVEVNFVWHDLGNWNSLWAFSEKDSENNYFKGNILANKVTNSYVRSENKLTTLLGLDNIVVVNTNDVTFIADISRAEEVRHLAYQNSINALDNNLSESRIKNTKYTNDWGYYQIIDNGPSYNIKKIVISIKAEVSLKAKFNVNERWFILQGEVEVSILNETKHLIANDYISISHNQVCNLINIGKTELHLIEIQTNA